MGRIVLVDCTALVYEQLLIRPRNRPSHVASGKFSSFAADTVMCYRGKTWPTMAKEWLLRHRFYGWPIKK